MARRLHHFTVVSCFFSLFTFLMANPSSAEGTSLYRDYAGKGEITFKTDLVDKTGKAQVDDLGSKLEKALVGRKSILFKPAQAGETARLEIHAEITEVFWTDKDPVDMIVGVGMAAMDAIKQDHYARIQANFRITDTLSKRTVWENSVKATVTDATMTEAESGPRVNEALARAFLKEAFSKKRAADR